MNELHDDGRTALQKERGRAEVVADILRDIIAGDASQVDVHLAGELAQELVTIQEFESDREAWQMHADTLADVEEGARDGDAPEVRAALAWIKSAYCLEVR